MSVTLKLPRITISAAWMVCAAFLSEFLGFEIGNGYLPFMALVGAGLACIFSLLAIWIAARNRAWILLAAGILAAVATIPVLFLAGLLHTCEVNHSCL